MQARHRDSAQHEANLVSDTVDFPSPLRRGNHRIEGRGKGIRLVACGYRQANADTDAPNEYHFGFGKAVLGVTLRGLRRSSVGAAICFSAVGSLRA